MYPYLEQLINEAKDPLYTAVKLAIAGNIIDFGPKETFDLNETISTVLKTPLEIDDYEIFRKAITTAQTLVYLSDNSGEIVFDKLLLELILKIANIQKITFIVKGMPFLNDALLEDAQDIGLDKIPQIEFVMVDAFYIPYLPKLRKKKQLAIKHGDQRCFTVAAASILAKVHRDNLMIDLAKRNPKYFLEKNKGYGTLAHRNAIRIQGPKRFHRKLFIRKYL